MKSKTLLMLGIAALAVSFSSGCATQKTRTGRNNTFLGGLVAVNTGSYKAVNPASADVDATKLIGFSNPSGTQITLLWETISLRDY